MHRRPHTTYNLAWALMAGVAVDIGSGFKVDLGYRYTPSRTTSAPASTGPGPGIKAEDISAHEISARRALHDRVIARRRPTEADGAGAPPFVRLYSAGCEPASSRSPCGRRPVSPRSLSSISLTWLDGFVKPPIRR